MKQDERDWLLSKSIPLSEVFDATGMGTKEYGPAMRAEDKYVAINVTPCKRAGHRIRTRTGKCMACDVTQYAFSKRHRTSGYVYLAASRQAGIIKVGMAAELSRRIQHLKYRLYGGADDWELVASVKEDSAGKLEAGIHSELLLFQTSGYYFDGDHKQSCFELFACDLETGINAFKKYGNEEDLRLHVDLDKFEFRPIASNRQPRSESPRNSLDRHKSNEPVFQEEIMAELDPALHSPREESLRDGDELKAPIKEKQLYISSNDVPPSHKTDTDHGQNKRRVPFAVLMVAAVIVGAGFVWVAIS